MDDEIDALAGYESLGSVPDALVGAGLTPGVLDEIELAAILVLGDTIDVHTVVVSRALLVELDLAVLLGGNDLLEIVGNDLALVGTAYPTFLVRAGCSGCAGIEKEAEALLASIRSMSEKGIAVIFITHRLHEILSVCDKVVVMRDGFVVSDVPAASTNVSEISKWMVGRSVAAAAKADIRDHSDAKTIMSIKRLWVDMPGETVRDVSLDVKEGEILGIGGLAGQGKLGIPNGIMGLYEAGGTVEFDGKQIPLNSPRKCLDSSLAFVSEDRRGVGLLLDETLEWNVAFPAMQVQNKFLKNYLGGLIKWRDEKAIREVTERYIDELAIKCTGSKQKAKELSGGNQQKICLAKAFALEPKFLFVSEPTRGIDVGAKALVLEALRQFNRESGVTVVMISSELEELRSICDRIAIVSGGKIAGILPATDPSEDFGMLMVSMVK